MLCSSCGTECTDTQEICPCCGIPLKKSPVSDDTIPLAPITEAVLAHNRKKPVKLDIAAILAADPDFAPAPEPDDSEPAQAVPDHDEASGSPAPSGDSAEPEVPASPNAEPAEGDEPEVPEIPEDHINPVEVLLLSLCILLGMAIAAMVILIICPNLITMLFYHA